MLAAKDGIKEILYKIGTLTSIRNPRLAKISTLYRNLADIIEVRKGLII